MSKLKAPCEYHFTEVYTGINDSFIMQSENCDRWNINKLEKH